MLLTNLYPDVMRWSPMSSDMYIVHCSIICYIDMLATLFIHLHICCIILSAISRIWYAYLGSPQNAFICTRINVNGALYTTS